MAQISLHWDGASLGDADALVENATDGIGYRLANEDYESPFIDRMMRAILDGTGNRGVLNNWLNELAVSGAGSPVAVNTGAAIIYGLYYENDSSLNVAVTSPTSDTRIDRLVVRRDWSAQTARITLIGGVEGSGVPPAITQSPAPDGTGIYDIPLAQLSITTGGVITVTDEREYCQFTLDLIDDALGTTHLVNEGADNAARQTRTKRKFIGGGDLEPALSGSYFTYASTPTHYGAMEGPSTWGSAAATEEGWQVANPVNPNQDFGFNAVFKIPDDYASGDITTYVWWMDDAGVATSIYIRTMYQILSDGADITYGGYNSETVADTWGTGEAWRTDGLTIDDAGFTIDDVINYCIVWYNTTASAEAMLILGLELEYTGYL